MTTRENDATIAHEIAIAWVVKLNPPATELADRYWKARENISPDQDMATLSTDDAVHHAPALIWLGKAERAADENDSTEPSRWLATYNEARAAIKEALRTGFCENFIVRIAGRLIVNEILGSCSVATSARHYDGTSLTSGGVVEVLNSSVLSQSNLDMFRAGHPG